MFLYQEPSLLSLFLPCAACLFVSGPEKFKNVICCSLFVFSHPPLNVLEQATIKQCVVGPNHAAFLLEVNYAKICSNNKLKTIQLKVIL